MIRFLLAFLSIYSLMHTFFYLRLRVILPDKWPAHLAVVIFLALMIFAPIGTRLLEQSGHNMLARISAHIGYCWMGFIFYAFWLLLIAGCIGILCKSVNLLAGLQLPTFAGQKTVLTILTLVVMVNMYGVFEARSIRVEKLILKSSKLPAGLERLRIAQISDVHLGLLVRESRMEQILNLVRAQEPDLLVSTGDLVDGDIDDIGSLPPLFEKVNPRFGKYAVTGNHEVFAGLSRSIRSEGELGFVVLTGKSETIGDLFNIVGVDDPMTGWEEDEQAVLRKTRNDLFTVFLKHRPKAASESLGLFDLQLSGHTHYGQLFPFCFFSGIVYPMQNGVYYLEKGSVLYTSRGSGTWGPPMRVLAPPEVTIIDVIRDKIVNDM